MSHDAPIPTYDRSRPSRWYWRVPRFPLTRIVLGVPAILVAGYFPVGLVLAVFGVEMPSATGAQMIAAACFAVPGATLAYWLLARFLERRSLSDLALRYAAKELALGAVLGVGFLSLIVGIIALCGGYRITGVHPASVVLYALGLAIVSGFMEEIIMRGVIYRVLEESLGTWIATVLTALLFGSLYALNDTATLAGCIAIAISAGPMMAWIYILTRRLWMCIGLHVAWNFMLVGVFGAGRSDNPAPSLLSSDRSGRELITGGDFGAEGSVVTILVALALSILLFVTVSRRGCVVRARRPGDP